MFSQNITAPALKIQNICLRYAENQAREALCNVSFELADGKLLALVGESGSGKSTLLRAIAGLEQPKSGTIEINGKIVFSEKQNTPPQDRKVGLVFQEYALFPHLNAASNIAFGLPKHKKNHSKTIVADMLETVGLKNMGSRYPHQLSGGEQQRIALARAIVAEPSLLLLDEPFSNMDESLKDQLRDEVINILKKINTTTILVTHDARDALSVADLIAVMRSGQLMQVDTPNMLYHNPVNEHVARFFGALNVFGKDKKFGIRPHDIRFGKPLQQTHFSFKGKILQHIFMGNYMKIVLQTNDGTRFIAHSNAKINTTDEIDFYLLEEDILHI